MTESTSGARAARTRARRARTCAEIVRAVRLAGGIARCRTLVAAGFSHHYLALAVADGLVVRVGRSWLAVPGVDPVLAEAARVGAVVTCVTQAERLGLWVLRRPRRPHLGCPPHGRADAGKHHVHWARPPVPRHPDAVCDPVENVLALVAECLPHDEALAVWESALNRGLVSIEVLRRLPFRAAARRLLDEATPWSDSGLESLVQPRLRFLGLPLVPQVWIAGRRVDLLIGDRLVLQIDGGSHVGTQREADNAHDALLRLMGYHVIRVGYRQVVERWHEVQETIMRAVAQGLHRADGDR